MSGAPQVVVVTPTRNRPELLRRSVESAAAQRGVEIRHVVVGDDCPVLADPAFTARLMSDFPHVTVVNTSPQTHPQVQDAYQWARVARLRNLGAALTDIELIAHLDDDNAWDDDHLLSLVDALAAAPEAEMAHSWRRVLYTDESPFLIPDGMDPWADDPQTGAKSYDLLVRAGVFVPGSNVLRDRLEWNGVFLGRVDTNELLIRRNLFERIPFPEVISRWKQKLGMGDDAIFNYLLMKARVPVVCTERATVRYYMGGNSNEDVAPRS